MSWLTAEQLRLTHVDAVYWDIDYDSLIEYAIMYEET